MSKKCKDCAIYDGCKAASLYENNWGYCRCFGQKLSDVLFEKIILNASHGDDGCDVDRDELQALIDTVRKETIEELKGK